MDDELAVVNSTTSRSRHGRWQLSSTAVDISNSNGATMTTTWRAIVRAKRLRIPLEPPSALFRKKYTKNDPLPGLPSSSPPRPLKRKTDAYKELVLLFRHISALENKGEHGSQQNHHQLQQQQHEQQQHQQRVLEILKRFPSLAGRGFPYYNHDKGGTVVRYPLFHMMGSAAVTIEIIEPVYNMFPGAISQRLPDEIPSMLLFAIWKKLHPTIIEFLVRECPSSTRIPFEILRSNLNCLPIHYAIFHDLPVSTCKAVLEAHPSAIEINPTSRFTDRLWEYVVNFTSNPHEMIKMVVETLDCHIPSLRIWGGESALVKKSPSLQQKQELLVQETLHQCRAREFHYFLQPWDGQAFSTICSFLKHSKTVQQILLYGEPNPGVEETEFLSAISDLLEHQAPNRRNIHVKRGIKFGQRKSYNGECFDMSWFTIPSIRIQQRLNGGSNTTLELDQRATDFSSLQWLIQIANTLQPTTAATTKPGWKLRLYLQRIVSHAPSSTKGLLLRDDSWNNCPIETLSLKFGLRGCLTDDTVLDILWKISEIPNLKKLGLCYLENRKARDWLNVTDIIVKLVQRGKLKSLILSSGMRVDIDPFCAALKELDDERGSPVASLERFLFDSSGYTKKEEIALARHMPKIFNLDCVEFQRGASGHHKDTVDVISYYAVLNRYGRGCMVQQFSHEKEAAANLEKFVQLLQTVSSTKLNSKSSNGPGCYPSKRKIKRQAILYGLLRFSPDFWLKSSLSTRSLDT